jgi:hypothetical protein
MNTGLAGLARIAAVVSSVSLAAFYVYTRSAGSRQSLASSAQASSQGGETTFSEDVLIQSPHTAAYAAFDSDDIEPPPRDPRHIDMAGLVVSEKIRIDREPETHPVLQSQRLPVDRQADSSPPPPDSFLDALRLRQTISLRRAWPIMSSSKSGTIYMLPQESPPPP